MRRCLAMLLTIWKAAQRAEQAAAAYQAVLQAQTILLRHPFPVLFRRKRSDVKAYQIGFDLASRGRSGIGLMARLRKDMPGKSEPTGSTSNNTRWIPICRIWTFLRAPQNLQGVYVALAYGFTDNFIGTFRYGHASRINEPAGHRRQRYGRHSPNKSHQRLRHLPGGPDVQILKQLGNAWLRKSRGGIIISQKTFLNRVEQAEF